MSINRRLDLAAKSVALLSRPCEGRNLAGADWDAVLGAVEKAIAEEDGPIFGTIVNQIEEYGDDPPHGFLAWLVMLQQGYATLPPRIPTAVLLAWRDTYASDWHGTGEPWCPLPLKKCQDCGMVLPHRTRWESCPVCGSCRVWYSDLSQPLGVAWINPKPYHQT